MDLKVGRRLRSRSADRSRDRRDRLALHANRRQGRDHRRIVDEGRDDDHDAQQHQGPRARVRRTDRQASVDVQHDSASGEFGNDTWLNGSWAINGNTGVWTQITVDEELGLVYLPVESPSSDYYGGKRPGNNLFGESLVCVDLKTGTAEVALPARASSDLGSRHLLGADPAGRDHRRKAAQAGRAAEQADVPLCVRPRDRRADLADRRNAGSAGDVLANGMRRHSRSRASRRRMRASRSAGFPTT